MAFVRNKEKLVQINGEPKIKRLSESMDTNAETDIRLEGAVHKGNVLIVDDEIDIVRTLLAHLVKNGYMAIGHTSGKDTLKGLKKYDFDLLIVDLVLTDMNGIDLLKAASEIDPYLVGIIITGKGSVQTAVAAMKAGAFDYLLKPFQFRMLTPILDRALKVRQLTISEEKYRVLVDELTDKVRELQNTGDMLVTKELEIFELREEIENLKEALTKFKELEKGFLLNGVDQ